MHKILFYADAKGKAPALEYIQALSKSGSKDARIKLNKIMQYIKVLEAKGTTAGEPYMKHLDGDIWELRPLRDRFLFAAYVGGSFVILHSFMKQTQKTPPREIEQAKRELTDFIARKEAQS